MTEKWKLETAYRTLFFPIGGNWKLGDCLQGEIFQPGNKVEARLRIRDCLDPETTSQATVSHSQHGMQRALAFHLTLLVSGWTWSSYSVKILASLTSLQMLAKVDACCSKISSIIFFSFLNDLCCSWNSCSFVKINLNVSIFNFSICKQMMKRQRE